MTVVLESLEALYPGIPWREPVEIEVVGLPKRIACRVCIARDGFKAADLFDSPIVFDDRQGFDAHFAEAHP